MIDERKMIWYIFEGIKGILAYVDNPKLDGITPVEEDGCMCFYPLNLLENVDIQPGDCCSELYSAYACYDMNVGEEIVYELVVNPYDKQRLIYGFVNKEMYEQYLYDRELKTETDRYYDWRSELTKYIDCVLYAWRSEMETLLLYGEDEEQALDNIKNEMEEKWNEVSAPYAAFNHAGDAQTFDNVWSMISERIRNLQY